MPDHHARGGTDIRPVSLNVLNYTFTVSAGSFVAPNDLGLVAVIDGRA